MTELQILIPCLARAGIELIVIGGVAATAHGSSYVTEDLDIYYARNHANLQRLATTLAPFHPRLRDAPEESGFDWPLYCTPENGPLCGPTVVVHFTKGTGITYDER